MSSTYCQNHEPETMKGCIWTKWQALCPAMVLTVFTSELPIVFQWDQGFHFVWKEEEINEEGLNNKNPTCLMGTMRVFLHSFITRSSILQLDYHHMQFSRCHYIEILVTEIRISYKISTHWNWQKNPLKSAPDRSKHAARFSQNITHTISHIHLPHLEQSKESIFHMLLVTRTHLNTRLKNNPIQFNKEIQLLSNEWYQESGHEFKSILLI